MTNSFEVLGEQQLNRVETLLVELLNVCQRDSHYDLARGKQRRNYVSNENYTAKKDNLYLVNKG